MFFEYTAADPDSKSDSEEDEYTAERILTDKPDLATPGGGGGYIRFAGKVLWKPPSSFVPRYTMVWLDYLKKKGITPDVQDVLVHLIMHKTD